MKPFPLTALFKTGTAGAPAFQPQPKCSSWSTLLSLWELGIVYSAGIQSLPEKTLRAAFINSLHVSPYSFLSPLPSVCPDSHKHMLQFLMHCIPCVL